MTSSQPRIVLATVTYNSASAIAGFFDSISAASTLPITVVIADNHSDDADRTRTLAQSLGFRFIGLTENRGYGGGITAAVEASTDVDWDYLLIANPDVLFQAGSIDRLVGVAEADPRVGAVGPSIINAEGEIYPSARNLPSLRDGAGHALFSDVWPSNPWTTRYHTDAYGQDERDAGWLSGACVLVRRDAYEQIGGFDTRFFMYFEDVDLGKRLGDLGWLNRYAPAAVVIHTGAHSTSRDATRMLVVHHESAYRYIAKHYSAWYWWPVRAAMRAGLAVRTWWLTRR